MAIMKLLSGTYLRAGRSNEAHASAQRSLELPRRLKRRGSEAEALRVLGEIVATSESVDASSAEALYRPIDGPCAERGMRPLIAHCHLGLGTLYRRTGKREPAQEHLTTATTMYREMEMTYSEKAEAELKDAQSATRA